MIAINNWNYLFTRSFVTGKTLIWAVIIVITSVVCSVFIADVFGRYFEYETIISIYDEQPDVLNELPAITICAANVFTPRRLAALYPEFNETYARFLAKIRHDHLPNQEEILENQREFDRFESKAFEDYNAYEVIVEKSVQIDDIVAGCKVYPVSIRNMFDSISLIEDRLSIDGVECSKLQEYMPSVYEGQKCFTYFSSMHEMKDRWQQYIPPMDDLKRLVYQLCVNDSLPCEWPNRQSNRTWNRRQHDDHWQIFHDLQTMIKIDVRMDVDTLHFLSDKAIKLTGKLSLSLSLSHRYVQFDRCGCCSVHSSNTLINKRKYKYLHVTGPYLYEVVFTRQMSMLLNRPYRPFCNHYGRYGEDPKLRVFHTSEECRNYCIKNYISQTAHSCQSYYNVLSGSALFEDSFRREHICSHDQQNISLYLVAKQSCETVCPEECQQSIYEISSYRLFSRKLFDCTVVEHMSNCVAQVYIRPSTKPFQRIQHRPAVSYEELIGAIGGDIGMLLGMSIFSFVSLAVSCIQRCLVRLVYGQ
ncbi:hypothetical protein BLA29_003749 [Euroglyphus maynei]|uniref:Uncharacterized protein n=1 Tax=Euroglyphus maynei TaxID=6958 RepID=A0A1Y3BHY9_EURMA|nr:hypothetical protein BLA29_003749 [Euroglyphus maynei]